MKEILAGIVIGVAAVIGVALFMLAIFSPLIFIVWLILEKV